MVDPAVFRDGVGVELTCQKLVLTVEQGANFPDEFGVVVGGRRGVFPRLR